MIRSIERSCSGLKELIRDQEKAEVSRAEGLLEPLEQEIAELRRRDAELEQLSHTEDHIHFLQSCQSLCAPPGPGDLPSITVSPHVSFEPVRKSVSELKERMEDVFKAELVKVSGKVGSTVVSQREGPGSGCWGVFLCSMLVLLLSVWIFSRSSAEVHNLEPKTSDDFLQSEVHNLEPKTRDDFLQYSCGLTLDPNTAHKHLRLSEGNREVTSVGEIQSYPDHPERFDYWDQVLCREGLSGRCYWEAEWRGDGVYIAVTDKDISRKGKGFDAVLGGNPKSWSLSCSPSGYSFRHNKSALKSLVPPPPE
ncbi:hypothetical protein COCON_G00071110 [Conger conger]|uniref:B30.2/SPRY domain-containing protein n=1 Tax=Conger conger TaxID=82655 RepID=A0A9Q1DTA3_CONCO|nr:hypothetical protein COCON_G00071110 [Conger conger]